MDLSYRQLEMVLASHMCVKHDRISTFRSRIKQLQRLEFPGGVNVGRGSKMAYSGEHLYKLAVAFELLGNGVPAQSAAHMVEKHWQEISAGLALAMFNRISGSLFNIVYVRFIIRNIGDIQFDGIDDGRVTGAKVEDAEGLADSLGRSTGRRAYCYTLLCISDIEQRVSTLAQEFGGGANATHDPEIIEWFPNDIKNWGSAVLLGKYKSRPAARMLEMFNKMTNDEARANRLLSSVSKLWDTQNWDTQNVD